MYYFVTATIIFISVAHEILKQQERCSVRISVALNSVMCWLCQLSLVFAVLVTASTAVGLMWFAGGSCSIRSVSDLQSWLQWYYFTPVSIVPSNTEFGTASACDNTGVAVGEFVLEQAASLNLGTEWSVLDSTTDLDSLVVVAASSDQWYGFTIVFPTVCLVLIAAVVWWL